MDNNKLRQYINKTKTLAVKNGIINKGRFSRIFLIWFCACLIVLATIGGGIIYKYMTKKAEKKKSVPVEVETVSLDSIEEIFELTGWIRANAAADLASKVSGRIESFEVEQNGKSVKVEEGLRVAKGQSLAFIDQEVYLAQLNAAKANLDAQKASYEDADREMKRMTALFDAGSSTAQTRDKAVTAANMAQSMLNSAQAALDLAQINMRESTIRAPFDGVITAKHIDTGNLVRAGDKIVTIADINTVKVIASLSEKYSSKITAGMPVRIKVDAFSNKDFEAIIYSVYPSLDEKTHTVQIEIRIDNSRALLKPGMFGRIFLIPRKNDNTVVVPRDVVLGGKIDKTYVYVVENNKAKKRIVEVGIKQSDRYEITDGLKPGEQLVVMGVTFLTDGCDVEVVRLKDIK